MRNELDSKNTAKRMVRLKNFHLSRAVHSIDVVFTFEWYPDFLMAGNDGAGGLLPYLRTFLNLPGHWDHSIYLFGTLGGTLGQDAAGIIPLYELGHFLRLNPVQVEVYTLFFVQLLFGFLSYKLFQTFSELFLNSKAKVDQAWYFLVAWACSFQTFMAWRIYYGHELILEGTLVFLTAVVLLLCFTAESMSVLTLLISVLSLVIGFSSSGQQMVLYGLVFGLPIFLYLAICCKKSLAQVSVIVLSALLLVLPRFYSTFVSAQNSDLSRNMSAPHVQLTYSYVIASFNDFLSSLPSTLNLISQNRQKFFWHEVNIGYGIGFFLCILLLFRQKQARYFVLSVFVSLVAAWLFAANWLPFSQTLLKGVPLLANFRVPHRAALISASLILPLAFSLLASLYSQFFLERLNLLAPVLVGGSIAAAYFLIGNELGEWEWMSLPVLLAVFFIGHVKVRKAALIIFTVMMVAFQLVGFKERQLSMIHDSSLLDRMATGEKIKAIAPLLKNPLYRSKLNSYDTDFRVNTAAAYGISSIEGYFYPMSRFSHLAAGLYDRQFQSTQYLFSFDQRHPSFKILSLLYNVAYTISEDETGLHIVPNSEAKGPAWFVNQIKTVVTEEDLYREIKSSFIAGDLTQKALVLSADLPPDFAQGKAPCTQAHVVSVEASTDSADARITVQTKGDCVLIVSTNYSKKLVARGYNSNIYPTFPAYGSLTAIVIPSSPTNEPLTLTLKGENDFPVFIIFAPWLGLLALLTIAIFMIYKSGRQHKAVAFSPL